MMFSVTYNVGGGTGHLYIDAESNAAAVKACRIVVRRALNTPIDNVKARLAATYKGRADVVKRPTSERASHIDADS